MTKNMGMLDRIIRVVIAVVIGALYYTETITGTLAIVLGVLAVVFLFTSVVAFCPLYFPFKINTDK